MATVPSSRGTPTRANSKKPKGRAPASAAASETTTLTGVPVRASSDPAWAAKATGSSSCDGVRPRRTAITTTTGTRAATEPLGLIRAVSRATTTMVRTSSRVRLAPARAISCCPTQAVTPVDVQGLADHEEGGDEDDRGVAEAGEGLVEGEHAGGVEGQRRADGHQLHRELVPDEEHDDRRQDGEADGDFIHGVQPRPERSGPIRNGPERAWREREVSERPVARRPQA